MKIEHARDKWSFLTHLGGAFLGGIGLIIILVLAPKEEIGRYVSHSVFGFSMIALYSCSAIYHYCPGPKEKIRSLRKLDHSMIFVLIAGTYTPIIYSAVPWPKGGIFLGLMWGLAILGVIMKIFWINAPRWLYTSIYLILGWAIVFDFSAVLALSKMFLRFLLVGGFSYTLGAILYILKKPNPWKEFGFHEIFHVFILCGTFFHFIGVVFYL